MTAVTQDFTIYAGDDSTPTFTLRDRSGAVVSLAAVAEIRWTAQRDLQSAIVIDKTLTNGDIAFVNDGSDGRFQVSIPAADSINLAGYYLHKAVVKNTDDTVATIVIGRMRVGQAPAWTYNGDPLNSTRDQVRFWIEDTDTDDRKILDPEIDYVLTLYPNPMLAAAHCCRKLAAKYASRVNKRVGDLSINYSDAHQHYLDLATLYKTEGEMTGLMPYAGGVSQADKNAVNGNSDRPKPNFTTDQFDNPSGPNLTTEPGWDTSDGS